MDIDYIKFKMIAMIAGILGAFIYSFFWLPPHIKEMKLYTKGFLIGSIGAVVPTILTSILLRTLGFDETNTDNIMALALVIGAIAPMFLNLMRNFSIKTKNKDIVTVAKELRSGVEDNAN